MTSLNKLPIRELIAQRELITLSPDMTLRDAAGVLDTHHIHGAPVLAAGSLVGVLTAADIVNFAASAPTVPELDLVRVPEDEGDQAETWEEDQPVSVYFTDFWDDAGANIVERIRATEGPEWDVLAEHEVSEAMSTGLRTLQATTPLPEAADYMLRHEIHRVLVLDGDRLLGMVSAMDFLRALAAQQSPSAGRKPARPPRSRRKQTPAAG